MATVPVRRIAAVALVVGSALAAGSAFVLKPGPDAPAAPVTAGGDEAFPAPPLDAVVFSRQLGSHVLALAVVSRRGTARLQASVLDEQGNGVRDLTVSFTVRGSPVRATACGSGCYRASVPEEGRLRTVAVVVRGAAVVGRWSVSLPARRPGPSASTLVARAARAWRSLRSLAYTEELASDVTHRVVSRWRIEAPDRIAYTVRGGPAGIVIGARRWDRLPPDEKWVASPQAPVVQPRPPWVSAIDAGVLGDGTVGGRAVWRVSFFDPGTPAWFAIAIDKRSFRTLDLRMVTTAHFMHDAYGAFNAAPAVEPPG